MLIKFVEVFTINLVIEGCDCVGKTTLINSIVKNSDRSFKVFHFQKPPESMATFQVMEFQKHMFFVHSNYLIHDTDIIFDRYHIGELIYGKLYREYDVDYIAELEKLIKEHCILICMSCNREQIEKRFDNKGMPRYDLEKVNNLFIKYCKESKLRKIFIDTSNNTPQQTLEELKLKLQEFNCADNICLHPTVIIKKEPSWKTFRK